MRKKRTSVKRKIGKRPFLLKFLLFLLLFVPALNFILLYIQKPFPFAGTNLVLLKGMIHSIPYREIPFYTIPFIACFGVYKIYRWAWFLLMSFALYGTGYFSYKVVVQPLLENLPYLFQAMFFMMIIAYFFQFEIMKPYLNRKGFRGWRENFRIPVNFNILVNGLNIKCTDLSPDGCALVWENHKCRESDILKLQFKLDKIRYTLKGRVVRAKKSSLGIAFDASKKTQKSIKNHLMHLA